MKRAPDIRQWASDRNLIEGSSPAKQFLKLVEEIGEAKVGSMRYDYDEVADGVGDTFVVLTIMCAQLGFEIESLAGAFDGLPPEADSQNWITALGELASGLARNQPQQVQVAVTDCLGLLEDTCNSFELNFEECVERAWNEIKDRKGRMIDGVFVKEADLV